MTIHNPVRGKVEVKGTIRGIDDIAQIRSVIDAMRLEEGDSLQLDITDSFSMPSSLIGYLLKLVEQQKVNLTLTVGNEVLAELLEDLNLRQVFNLRQRAGV